MVLNTSVLKLLLLILEIVGIFVVLYITNILSYCKQKNQINTTLYEVSNVNKRVD